MIPPRKIRGGDHKTRFTPEELKVYTGDLTVAEDYTVGLLALGFRVSRRHYTTKVHPL